MLHAWPPRCAACRDLNPLYNSTLEASLLFGSGARAGVDRREQKKQAASHKAALLRKMRESQVRRRALLTREELPAHPARLHTGAMAQARGARGSAGGC